jgi:hypothetical protein
MRKSSMGVVAGCFVLAAALNAAPADRSLTATGTIVKVEAAERAVTLSLADGSQTRFFWNPETKISGVLAPGAKVTIRYEVSGDGRNLAQQISVARS